MANTGWRASGSRVRGSLDGIKPDFATAYVLYYTFSDGPIDENLENATAVHATLQCRKLRLVSESVRLGLDEWTCHDLQ